MWYSASSLTPLCSSVDHFILLLCERQCLRPNCPCALKTLMSIAVQWPPVPRFQSRITVENVLNPICCDKYPPQSLWAFCGCAASITHHCLSSPGLHKAQVWTVKNVMLYIRLPTVGPLFLELSVINIYSNCVISMCAGNNKQSGEKNIRPLK